MSKIGTIEEKKNTKSYDDKKMIFQHKACKIQRHTQIQNVHNIRQYIGFIQKQC